MMPKYKNNSFSLKITHVIIIAFLQTIIIKCQEPIGFAVVRHIPPSIDFQSFLQAIGRPKYDQSGTSRLGYSMMSLGGFNQKSSYQGIENTLSPLMLWKKMYQIVLSNKPNIYGDNSKKIQKYIMDNIFHFNNSNLLMHVDVNNLQITKATAVSDAQILAQQIVTTATQMSLDGVSINFMDYNAVKDGVASEWLESLLKNIKKFNRNNLQLITVLIISPLLVDKMKTFKSPQVNSIVDYYVLKYYDTAKGDYYSYQTLFQRANNYLQSAVFQIQKKTDTYIDICKTLIAKPPTQKGTWNTRQFIDSNSLRNGFLQAYNKIGWFAGYANLNFQADKNGIFVNSVLSSLRDQCSKLDNCFC